ncbi:hypothetical protein OIU78_002117 [Salix suchowensis]|uniref:Uncharacterized protein n=1 Tax=Salix koriyanagi TaxID=2511006 RepID=A0A9Q0ZSZ3_9ROSI|nr:hypothetical protein OIU78_002117 [Salix suchowensis]KAJ6745724.1 hypothetical protein OIU74_028403 [Salix koriyanagi]
MADKASRGLVIYGDGLASFINPSHAHLHSLASKAFCGFLSLPNAPPSESEEERIVREFAYLLDACEAYQNVNSQNTSIPTISERFMGMKAAIITNNPGLKSFGGKLGLTVFSFNDINGNGFSLSGSSTDFVTSELLKLLGFQEGKTLETSQFDLVFVHVGAGERVNGEGQKTIAIDVEYIDALVDGIMRIAQPGSEIGSRLHLSLVMSFGYVTEGDGRDLSILTSKDEMDPALSKLFPSSKLHYERRKTTK